MSDDTTSRQSNRLSLKADDLPSFPTSAWRGVFGEYLRLMDPVSECPSAYHFPNLLTMIAAELGPDVCFDEGTDPRLNFFIISCGESGTKKSTATTLARKYFAEFIPSQAHARITSVSSGEGLIRTLIQHPNLYLACDEIKDLFTLATRQGSRLEQLLNSAFDQGELQGNIKSARDSVSVSSYFLNTLLNGTPDHMRECSESLFRGGLFNRFLTFAAPPTNKSMPVMGKPDALVAQELAVRIASQCAAWRNLGLGPGTLRIRLSADASKRYVDWYERWNAAQKARAELESFPLKRLDVYVKKLTSVFCVLEAQADDAGAEASDDQMAAALDIIAYCERCMTWLAYQWTGLRSIQQQADAIAEQRALLYLSQHGCIAETVLYQAMKLSHAEFNRAISALEHHGFLTITSDKPRQLHFKKSCTCYEVVP